MTVKELIEMLKTCDEESIVYIDLNVGSNYARIKAEDKIWEGLGFVLQWTKEVNSINANGLYVIRKAGSNRAGFIKFND